MEILTLIIFLLVVGYGMFTLGSLKKFIIIIISVTIVIQLINLII